MINKIQQYLRLHHSIIWNIRLVPMLLILLGVHLFFFMISYLSSEISFEDTYYYRSAIFDSNGLLYVSSVLVGILLLIGWLIFYMRNNAFNNFYPKKAYQLYVEWLLIFSVCSMIALLPVSLVSGTFMRWRSVASYDDTKKTLDMLAQANMLIPNLSNYNYTFNKDIDSPIPLTGSIKLDMSSINLDNYAFDYNSRGEIVIRGYTGPSLLFYSPTKSYKYTYNESSDDETKKLQQKISIVKQWLKDGETDSIKSLMKRFNALQAKHNISTSLSVESWFKRIYKPPYFTVDATTSIFSTIDPYRSYYYTREYNADTDQFYIIDGDADTIFTGNDSQTADYYKQTHTPAIGIQELSSGYQKVLSGYEDTSELCWLVLFCLCVSTVVSVFVFSYRVTSGKAWLIAFVSSGVLIFAVGLAIAFIAFITSSSYSRMAFFALFWLVLFVVLLCYILTKNKTNVNKGKSPILLNIMCWLLPCVVPFSYMFFISTREVLTDSYYYTEDSDVECMFWIAIFTTIVVQGLMAVVIRKWKSLPEE